MVNDFFRDIQSVNFISLDKKMTIYFDGPLCIYSIFDIEHSTRDEIRLRRH